MKGCVVNVATGYFVKGQERLRQACDGHAFVHWADAMPPGCPPHSQVPYAFKAHALYDAAKRHSLLLWADASILPIGNLEQLFERIDCEGYWISRNGWMNSEWTAESAYEFLDVTREENARIPHVVATAFGVNAEHPQGKALLEEYYRLARTTAFCGPWRNTPETPCGNAKVFGHRHDQTALSVIAWKLGLGLTEPPNIFAYKGGETRQTILLADGAY